MLQEKPALKAGFLLPGIPCWRGISRGKDCRGNLIGSRMHNVHESGEAPGEDAPGGVLVSLALGWFVLSPWMVLALGTLAEGVGMGDDERTLSQLGILYGLSMLLAFLIASVGACWVRNARGQRRWGTSVAAWATLVVYVMIALSTVRAG